MIPVPQPCSIVVVYETMVAHWFRGGEQGAAPALRRVEHPRIAVRRVSERVSRDARGQADQVAAHLYVGAVEEAALGYRHVVLVAHPHAAVGEGEPHRLRHDVQSLRLAEAEAGRRVAQRVALDHLERLDHGQAARRGRRHRRDAIAAVLAHDRLADHDVVVGQVLYRHEPGTPTAWPLVDAELKSCLLPSGLVNNVISALAGALSRPSIAKVLPCPFARCTIMKPPPPMPENSGSTTLSANWMAAAASMALPPLRSILAPASAASGCDTATTPPRKPGPGGTASPETSCDAQAGAKLRTVKLSTSSDLRISGPRSQPAVARIRAHTARFRVHLLHRREVVRGVAREFQDGLQAVRDTARVVPRHRCVDSARRRFARRRKPVEARGVEAEDLALRRLGELRIAVQPAQLLGDLEAPQRVDLPLRRAVPHRVGAEYDAVLAHELHELAEDVRADL